MLSDRQGPDALAGRRENRVDQRRREWRHARLADSARGRIWSLRHDVDIGHKRGLVHSVRGRSGGYQLGRATKDISFAEIIRSIDGPLALSPCASRTAYRRCEDCTDEATCAIRKSLIDVRNSTAKILEQHSLADALADRRKVRPAA